MAVHQGAHGEEKHGLSNGMLGFYLFLASELMFFGGLFAAYFTARAEAPEWPPHSLLSPEQIASGVELELHIGLPLIATIILIISSITVQMAVMQIKKGNQTGLIWFLFISVVLGAIFLVMQLYDYAQLHFRADDTVFGSTFYTLTGFHGLHVLGGAIFMGVVLLRALGGQFSAKHHDAVEATSMYWHFVDVIWVVLFTILYVIE